MAEIFNLIKKNNDSYKLQSSFLFQLIITPSSPKTAMSQRSPRKAILVLGPEGGYCVKASLSPTALAVANFFGLPALGVELSPRRARHSRRATPEGPCTQSFRILLTEYFFACNNHKNKYDGIKIDYDPDGS